MDPNFQVSSATFSYVFQNLSRITTIQHSPACWIRTLPWKIFIEPVLKDGKKYLSVFVGCTEPITAFPWSCRASVRMYKLDGVRPKIVRTTTSLVFDSTASISWGHVQFMLWDAVLNPANGFINKDSITFEVTIDAEMPVGIKRTANHFTDERANTALKACETSVEKLQKNIEELGSDKENLKEKNISILQELENMRMDLQTSLKQKNDVVTTLEEQRKEVLQLQNFNHELDESIRAEKQKYDKLQKDYENINTLVSKLTDELNEAQENLKVSCPENESDSEMRDQLEEATVTEDRDTLRKNLLNLSGKLENWNNKINSREIEMNERLNELQTANQNLTSDNAALNIELKEALKKSKTPDSNGYETMNLTSKMNYEIEKYGQLQMEKESCDNRLSLANEQLGKAKELIDKLTRQLGQYQSNPDIKSLDVQQKASESNIDQLTADLTSMRNKLSSEISSLESEKDKLKIEKQNLTSSLDEVRNELKLLHKINSKLKIEQLAVEFDETKTISYESLDNLHGERDKLDAEIVLLKSKLESLKVKLNIPQKWDSEDKIEEISNELNSSKMTLESALSTHPSEEKELETKIQFLESHLDDIKGKLNSLQKRDSESKIEQLSVESKNSSLRAEKEKSENENRLLRSKLDELKEKLNILEKTNSQLKNEEPNEDLESTTIEPVSAVGAEMNILRAEKQKLETEMQMLKSQLNDVNQSLTLQKNNSESKINQLNTELTSMKAKLIQVTTEHSSEMSNLRADREKFEAETQLLKSKLLDVAEKLKKSNQRLQDQDSQKTVTEKNSLEASLDAANKKFEQTKIDQDFTRKIIEEKEKLKKEGEELKSEISFLKEQLSQSKDNIHNLNEKLNKISESKSPMSPNLNSEYQSMDSFIDKKRNFSLKDATKLDREKKELTEKFRNSVQAKVRLGCGINGLRRQFEKKIRDEDEKNREQRRTFLKNLADLEFQLDEEKRKTIEAVNSKTSLEDEIIELKKMNDSLNSVKNTLVSQLNDCHQLGIKALSLVGELGNSMKSSGKLPTSVADHLNFIIESMDNMKLMKCNQCERNSEDKTVKGLDLLSAKDDNVDTQESDIQRMNALELRMQEKVEIISRLYLAETRENEKLKISVHQLSTLLENETLLSKQYKDLSKFADSRLEDLRNELIESDNLLYKERKRLEQSKKKFDQLTDYVQILEGKFEDLKESLWQKAADVDKYPMSFCEGDGPAYQMNLRTDFGNTDGISMHSNSDNDTKNYHLVKTTAEVTSNSNEQHHQINEGPLETPNKIETFQLEDTS